MDSFPKLKAMDYPLPPSSSPMSGDDHFYPPDPDTSNPSNYDESTAVFIVIMVICVIFIILMLKSSYDMIAINENNNIEETTTDIENPSSRARSSHGQIILISNIKCLINDDCPICIESFKENDELYQLKCGHIFHTECITEWININNICPTCRKVVIDT